MAKKRKRSAAAAVLRAGSLLKSARLKIKASAAFCSKCVEMTSTASGVKRLRSSRGYKHHGRWQLSVSSRSCLFCNGVFSQVRHDWNPDIPGQMYVFERDHNFVNWRKTLEAIVVRGRRSRPNHTAVSTMARATFELSHNDMYFYGTIASNDESLEEFPPRNMRSARIFDRARKCLQICKTQHKLCNLQSSTLPKRVLDVRPRVDGTIKLHVTRKSEKHEYVALSYCWGGPQDFITTKKTLRYRVRGITISELPQTIQDAIWVTRVLGIRYLWVDSLCILQDDTFDTTREIGSMGDVYKNAILTIAAANVPSVNDGFLRLAHYTKSRMFYMNYHNQPRKAALHYDTRDSVDPLDLRAWAFQESLLSRRLLIFSDGEVLWRCQQPRFPPLVSSEIITRATSLVRLPSGVFASTKAKGSVGMYGRQQIVLWEQIVEDYSKRKLTFSHDRLPGIAGVASELAKVWDDKYLAGLWASCLLNHLGWRPVSGEDMDWRKVEYQAPTWSWASIRCGVKFTDINIPSAEILSCTVKPLVEEALFGQVASGELVIRTVDIGELDSPFSTSMRDKSPALVNVDLLESQVKYPLLGYTSKREGVGLILVQLEDGHYARHSLWIQEMTTEERACYNKTARKHVFRIL